MPPTVCTAFAFGTQLSTANGLTRPESQMAWQLELTSASSLSPRQRTSYEPQKVGIEDKAK